jgi:hypothetical protein
VLTWQITFDEDEAAALRDVLERAVPQNNTERRVIRHLLSGDFGRRRREFGGAARR